MKRYSQPPFFHQRLKTPTLEKTLSVGRLFVRTLLIGLATISLSAGLTGCFFGGADESEAVDSIAQPLSEPSRLENRETNVQITVPANWTKADSTLRSSADIYASYDLEELYVSVLSESDEVLSQFSLEDNAEQYRSLIEKELSSYEGATPTEVTQVDGDPAIQQEIRGQVGGVSVVYLHTTIQGENRYYQVVGWTTAERYAENKETLQEIISSFEGA